MTPTSPLGAFLFDYLYDKGVRHVFGIPGDFALPTFRWLERSKLDIITMTHEPSVGFAADGYARTHGLGVACVTYCVGGLNLLNAAACAYAEKSPVLVISGAPSAQDRKGGGLLHHKVRSFDTQRRVFEEVTCATAVLLDPATAAQEIMRVTEAVLQQCRPGYIEVPYDMVDKEIPIPPIFAPAPPAGDAENLAALVEDVAARIARAKRPVIIADVELHRHKLSGLALRLAERHNIPVAATLLSKSIISEAHPLFVGVYSGNLSSPGVRDYVDESDCVILLGAFITDVFLGLNKTRMPRRNSILLTTEKAQAGYHTYDDVPLKDALEALCAADIPSRPAPVLPPLAPRPAPLRPEERDTPLDVAGFFRILGLHMRPNDTLVCDTGDALLGAMDVRTEGVCHFLADAYYLSMGFAVPAAIGAMAARPDSRTFVVVGDGAFQMTGVELSTAAKYGMKPVVLILNNDGYGTQRHILDGSFNEIRRWRYTEMTTLFDYGKGVQVRTYGELDAALKAAETPETMHLVEAVVPRDDCSAPLRRMGEMLGKLRKGEK